MVPSLLRSGHVFYQSHPRLWVQPEKRRYVTESYFFVLDKILLVLGLCPNYLKKTLKSFCEFLTSGGDSDG
ncbi:MAG: hypothetical protein GAK43_01476 [Stenotrophomonas maltophilia]|nr:MAG: hypothetical protein GAK43_01476 [Stenotrophomonas maltophilia]